MKAKGQYTTTCHSTRNKHIDVKLTLSVNEPMIKDGVMMANINCKQRKRFGYGHVLSFRPFGKKSSAGEFDSLRQHDDSMECYVEIPSCLIVSQYAMMQELT